MLSLKNITKNYTMGDTEVKALKGVSIDFRENEFVSILGQSGCGKTTLLNIIGGLDRYTDGDLVIDGVSTKKYRDRDWDTYRNHRIGFVFQSYNLIPHQTVLANVELALTLSGVSKHERRRRAVEVLTQVGLKDQMKKKPNQMSGGQMQRVAIARALINNPDILLADEPTGALDSETSLQIMEILKDISKDKLIIMVTHNPELAEKYSSRIIRLVDGKITGDTDPYTPQHQDEALPAKVKKTSMSFPTALSLSLNNLMTKKGRTILTSFAGSIGIIGIALILSLSNGVQEYIDGIQRDTLASYPLTIDNSSTDLTSFMSSAMDKKEETAEERQDRDDNKIHTTERMGNMFTMMYKETNKNDLKSFREFLDNNEEIDQYVTNINYSYGLTLQVFSKDEDGEIIKVNPSGVLNEIGFGAMAGMFSLSSQMSSSAADNNVFIELTDNEEMFNTRYELIAGKKPENKNEALLIVDKHNEITDYTLYTLGLMDVSELKNAVRDMMAKKDDSEISKISAGRDYDYDELIGITFTVVPQTELYQKNDENVWIDMSKDNDFMAEAMDNGEQLEIVGIVRQKEGSSAISGLIGYTKELTAAVAERINGSEIIKQQEENPDYDVFSGLPFENTEAGEKALEDAKKQAEKRKAEAEELQKQLEQAKEAQQQALENLPEEQQALLSQMSEEERAAYLASMQETAAPDISSLTEEQQAMLAQMSKEERAAYLASMGIGGQELPVGEGAAPEFDLESFDPDNITEEQMEYFMSMSEEERSQIMKMMTAAVSDVVSPLSLYENRNTLGVIDLETPSAISIYPIDFEAKEKIVEIIDEYNKSVGEEKKITYTDMVGMLMSSVTEIINAISYILIAFVAISLVVSSIMIGIITYISVLERTKEIGILRSIGASKKDISRVFNAETVIVGFISGAIGILVTVLLNIPINIIIKNITNIEGLSVLPPVAGIILTAISVCLTLIAGLFPSGVAAKKDPVVALRTE